MGRIALCCVWVMFVFAFWLVGCTVASPFVCRHHHLFFFCSTSPQSRHQALPKQLSMTAFLRK